MSNSQNPGSYLSLADRLGLPETPFLEMMKQFSCDLRVCAVGIVQSFDPVAQTVAVQIVIKEWVKKNQAVSGGATVPVATEQVIPVIYDVPISVPRGGGMSFTLPIQPGDECLVLFTDNCFDAWWQNGGVQSQEKRRRHDMSDAVAVFGVWSQPRKLPAYSTTQAELRTDDGTVKISISLTGVTITGNLVVNGTITANDATIASRLFSTHKHTGVTTGGGTSGPPL